MEELLLDLLEWIGDRGRPYADVMDAWRTSCPHLPVWEEAMDRGWVHRSSDRDGETSIALTQDGRAILLERRG